MEMKEPSIINTPYSTIPEGTSTYPNHQDKEGGSSLPLIAGLLLIIAGVIGVLTWVSVLFIDPSMIESVLNAQGQTLPITADQLQSILMIYSIIGIVLSIVELLGGVMAIKRRLWVVAVVGGVLGLPVIGPLFLSTILSFISFVLLILSKKEFKE